MKTLYVYREYEGSYEAVGLLEGGDSQPTTFAYDVGYLSSNHAVAVSPSLPLQDVPFDPRRTASFFDGLVPEGSLRRDIEAARRIERGDYLGVLEAVQNEPIGALLFSDEDGPRKVERAYRPLGIDQLAALAAAPAPTALDMTLESRISLAGAQSKVGLYHAGPDSAKGWYLPIGTAPSTHIVKACSDAYPGESVCEALCMRAAIKFDLPAAKCFLISADEHEPLLAVERYDRFLPEVPEKIGSLAVPRRLHQVDMCQACGTVPSSLKYEPSGVSYLGVMADVVRRVCEDPQGDRYMLGYYLLFDYAVGNCDNHLKNWSLLWDVLWERVSLAPLYDVVCTTIYPHLAREMGISFGGSRLIDDVCREAVLVRLESAGIARFIGETAIEDVSGEVPGALEAAADELSAEGFPLARDMLSKMIPGVKERLEKIRR